VAVFVDGKGESVYSPFLDRREPLTKPLGLPQGTLEMLILKAVSLGPLHGYGILLRFKTDSSTKSIFLRPIYARLPPSAFCRRGLRKRARCARLSGS
jgi:hypothetical protein